ncbi:MAG TPA: GAF domain-containing protein [Anaerolineae bacterium]|nr:GAF domain-containing protein [Anaerolineae bacterium]
MLNSFFKQFRSIRVQIRFGFGILLLLLGMILAISFLSVSQLQTTFEETVTEASQIRELSLGIENDFLLAREHEANFLNSWRVVGFEVVAAEEVPANEANLAAARQKIEELKELVGNSNEPEFVDLADTIEELSPLLDEYERAFQATVDNIGARSQTDSVQSIMRNELESLQASAELLPNPAFYRIVLQIEANEQAYLGTSQQQYSDSVRLLTGQFKRLVETSAPSAVTIGTTNISEELISRMDLYASSFQELVALEEAIRANSNLFRDVTSDIRTFTSDIGTAGASIFAEAQRNLVAIGANSRTLLAVTGTLAIVIGFTSSYLLARQILRPLSQLNEAAEKIGAQNFEEKVEVSGAEEFSVLANTFNQMTQQLRDVLTGLEQRVRERTRALEASADVSRSLSTILDPQQLIIEVVEKIKTAFDYYHVHIYLLDESGRRLNMVGGTGHAGRHMLAQKHSLRVGQGMVGRAAETMQPVLAADVQREPNWLPNPLLPQTKSELAVPIVIGEKLLGVLDVQQNEAHGLDASDISLLQSIANQAAIALSNAQLYAQTQQQVEREAMINEINQKIQATTDVRTALQVAVRELGRAVGSGQVQVRLEQNEQK